MSTFAGKTVSGWADDLGTLDLFNMPWGVAIDAWGNLYVTDEGNNRIRKISSSGISRLIAYFRSCGILRDIKYFIFI